MKNKNFQVRSSSRPRAGFWKIDDFENEKGKNCSSQMKKLVREFVERRFLEQESLVKQFVMLIGYTVTFICILVKKSTNKLTRIYFFIIWILRLISKLV